MARDIKINYKDTGFPAYLVEPETKTKGGVIVIHEVWGLNKHTKDIANRFASQGYMALAPNLFSDNSIEKYVSDDLARDLFNPEKRNEAQPKLREIMAPIHAPLFAVVTKEKLANCFNYLFDNGAVNQSVAVVGFCFGGTYSFQLAINEPRLKAALPFYGSADFSIDELSRIKCPVLAFYGEQDERLMNQLPELKKKMARAEVNFKVVVYPDSGHAFFNDTNPYAYNQSAAQDAWAKTLKFLAGNIN